MRAMVQRTYGPPDLLRLERIPRPEPGAGEVLVRVRAAGIDRGTWHLLTGRPLLVRAMGFGLRGPRQPVPGLDLAGVVEEVGEGVSGLARGDEVLGIGIGALAEHARARAGKLVRKPPALGWAEAGVTAVSGLTALQALTDVGRLREGKGVLVLGASGGVGSFAVQIARALGGRVTGVASTPKLDMVRALGAERVIDYTREDATDGSRRYDLIVDTGGNTPLRRLRRSLSREGTLVIVGGEQAGGALLGGFGRQLGAAALSPLTRQRLVAMVSKEDQGLDRLAALIADGAVRPALGRTYRLEEAAEAVRDLVAGRVAGKAAVVVADD